ncbi:SusC/RagA family TonB-linked outer membrane protein [Pedobacter faecalis]|uniref:SusC/RagA family TonB-linked outer membrane protein n=1 Tax=Pedobacter faecalis TaxID=3041495 RepID=UPI00254C730C|nr:SusC/RagA family TonB-linked outer membrane protein [Pedobacter sp. ELA7]
MQVSAASFGQRLTLIGNNVKLERIFNEIQKQTGYGVLVSTSKVDTEKGIKVNFRNTALTDVMDQLTKGSDLAYTIEDKVIVIKEKTPSILDRVIARFQAIDVRGKVVDSLGNGLPGATVSVKNGKGSTSTDAGGNFQLKNVDEGAVLVVSYLGYVTKEVAVHTGTMTVTMRLSTSKLDEVLIQAYGVTSRRLNTGNTSSVKAVDISKQPVNNPLLALSGRVPGLIVSQASGFSGSGVRILIQGQNSIGKGNDPFFVIDGVPYVSQLLPNSGNVLGVSQSAGASESNFGNPLSFINPSDIESIDILKDADATAIYGSRAANGAVLITTKRGKESGMTVDVSSQLGFGRVPRKMELLNINEYLSLRKSAYLNDNLSVPTALDGSDVSNYDLTMWDQTRDIDWQKELIGRNAEYQDQKISLSGGTDQIQYLFSAGYHRETTVFPGNFSDKKGSVHFNMANSSKNQKFKFSFSGTYVSDDNRLTRYDLTEYAMTLAPNTPSLKNNDGSLNWAPNSEGISSLDFFQPLALLNNRYDNKTVNLITSSDISYQITRNLRIKSNFGYTNLRSDELVSNPLSAIAPENRATSTRRATYRDNNIRSWIVEPQIDYRHVISKGVLTSLLGTTFQQVNSIAQQLNGSGYSSDEVLDNINSATSISTPLGSTINSVYKYHAVFGKLNYNWENKYIINFTGRYDGSSRFGGANSFHAFGAMGAAWVFSNESFSKELLPFISFGKLKFSYGVTGNDQIGNYQYLSLYDNINPPISYSGGPSLIANSIANPYLQWEETRKLSFGIDVALFNDRLLLETNYYRNRSSNQLLATALPSTAGVHSLTINLPAKVQNNGFEFTINSTVLNSKVFSWKTGANLTVPRNKLIEFENLESSIFYADYKVGEPITFNRLYDFVGVNQSTGLYEYRDKDGNLINDPTVSSENLTRFVNTSQTLYGGINNSFSYRSFALDFLFQFVRQMGQNYFYGNGFPGAFSPVNQPRTVLNAWNASNSNARVQKYSSGDFDVLTPAFAIYSSNAVWADASYIRLKNLSLSWAIPQQVISKLKMRYGKVFVQGQNLLTITNYQGLDPETKSSLTLPPLRVISTGIQVTF